MQERASISRTSRALHISFIVLAIVSYISGYMAFDISWSGVGVLNRSTYFMAHQTSGTAFLLLSVYGVSRLIRRRAFDRSRPGLLDHAASMYHVALLAAFFFVSALAIWGTACGGYSFQLAYFVSIPLSVPDAVCAAPVTLFEWHKEWANGVLLAVGVHVAAAIAHLILGRDRRVQDMFAIPHRDRGQTATH